MSADIFECWFSEKLLSNVSNNAIIVMETAITHKKKFYNPSKKKKEIQEFVMQMSSFFKKHVYFNN